MSQENCRAVLDAWTKALKTQNTQEVLKLYHSTAVLVPTLSNVLRQGDAALADYFDMFLAKQPSCTIRSAIYTEIIPDSAGILSGIYDFEFGKDGSKASARYSYVLQSHADAWCIMSHHSSLLPE